MQVFLFVQILIVSLFFTMLIELTSESSLALALTQNPRQSRPVVRVSSGPARSTGADDGDGYGLTVADGLGVGVDVEMGVAEGLIEGVGVVGLRVRIASLLVKENGVAPISTTCSKPVENASFVCSF